jgi:hypothetical protein
VGRQPRVRSAASGFRAEPCDGPLGLLQRIVQRSFEVLIRDLKVVFGRNGLVTSDAAGREPPGSSHGCATCGRVLHVQIVNVQERLPGIDGDREGW